MGLSGLEPPTSRLSGVRSNRLSYKPSNFDNEIVQPTLTSSLRKEVIQPHLPVLLPCYDFTPVMKPTVVAALPKVRQTPSGEPHSHGVTGGVYKTRERIHRGMLIRDY